MSKKIYIVTQIIREVHFIEADSYAQATDPQWMLDNPLGEPSTRRLLDRSTTPNYKID